MAAGAIAMLAATNSVRARRVSRRWNAEFECPRQLASFDFLSHFGSSDGNGTMASPYTWQTACYAAAHDPSIGAAVPR
jgi:hypothetical protein